MDLPLYESSTLYKLNLYLWVLGILLDTPHSSYDTDWASKRHKDILSEERKTNNDKAKDGNTCPLSHSEEVGYSWRNHSSGLRKYTQSWISSAIESIYCYCRRCKFDSQHSHIGSRASVISVSWSQATFSVFHCMRQSQDVHINIRENIEIHIK